MSSTPNTAIAPNMPSAQAAPRPVASADQQAFLDRAANAQQADRPDRRGNQQPQNQARDKKRLFLQNQGTPSQ